MQQKSDARLEARLDRNHYNEAELLELRIPIHLEYQINSAAFERVNGEVKVDGILYKYVKRKVTNDTLVLLCIPNHQKMDLQKAWDDFFKNTNDIAQGNNSKKSDNSKSISFKKITSEYEEQFLSFNHQQINSHLDFGIVSLASLSTSPHVSPEQPPEAISA
jgi:hypothetical protein